jgi:hypothetical protein
MKNGLILTCALCVLFLATGEVLASSGGRADAASEDGTGGPFNDEACSGCHSKGSYGTTVTLEVFDNATTNPAGPDLQANTNYDLRFTVNTASGAPTEFGFQLVVLNDSDESNNGTITNPSGNSAVVPLNTRSYWEHNSATATQQWTADWLSGSDTGGVTFFYTGEAGTGFGDSNGTAGDSTGGSTPVSLQHFEVD